mmetsp:Transcript_1236/g.2805  ORF Transcript_1236/g.2805 Transcript_1236/m.2805 type:complete len:205 (-) Transcript_1236:459-1073(-)
MRVRCSRHHYSQHLCCARHIDARPLCFYLSSPRGSNRRCLHRQCHWQQRRECLLGLGTAVDDSSGFLVSNWQDCRVGEHVPGDGCQNHWRRLRCGVAKHRIQRRRVLLHVRLGVPLVAHAQEVGACRAWWAQGIKSGLCHRLGRSLVGLGNPAQRADLALGSQRGWRSGVHLGDRVGALRLRCDHSCCNLDLQVRWQRPIPAEP